MVVNKKIRLTKMIRMESQQKLDAGLAKRLDTKYKIGLDGRESLAKKISQR